jgi:hypothetical protein
MDWLNNPKMLLQPNERAVWFCFICKRRSLHRSRLAARRGWNKHRRETNHDLGWIAAREDERDARTRE